MTKLSKNAGCPVNNGVTFIFNPGLGGVMPSSLINRLNKTESVLLFSFLDDVFTQGPFSDTFWYVQKCM